MKIKPISPTNLSIRNKKAFILNYQQQEKAKGGNI